MKSYDVVIVGAGPGGSTAAALLGKQGRSVLLLEKARFPRDKTCGDAISGKSATVLRELGLVDAVEAGPHAEVHGVTFSSPKGTVVEVDFPRVNGKAQGYVCRRLVYDNLVFENVKKYAEFVDVWERFQVTDVIQENGFVVGVRGLSLDTKKEEEVRARVVLGADGATSVVASKLGLNPLIPEHHCGALRVYYKGIKGLTNNIEIHFVQSLIPGYFWIFPLEDGLANVGVGMLTSDIQKRKVNLKQAMFDVIEKVPMFQERFKDAQMVGDVKGWNLPFGSHRRKSYGNGFLLLGDAASLIDPFSGEGIGNAMTSASLAAKTLQKAFEQNDFSEKLLSEYDTALWAVLEHEMKNSYRLQKLGKRTFLLNWVIGRAAKRQKIREALSVMLSNRDQTEKFADPLFYFKLFFM